MIIDINFGKGFGYKKTESIRVISCGFFYVVILRRKILDAKLLWEAEARHAVLKATRECTPDILNYKTEEELKPFLAILDLSIEASRPKGKYEYPKFMRTS